jgi:hypothetical protein
MHEAPLSDVGLGSSPPCFLAVEAWQAADR